MKTYYHRPINKPNSPSSFIQALIKSINTQHLYAVRIYDNFSDTTFFSLYAVDFADAAIKAKAFATSQHLQIVSLVIDLEQ